MLATTQWPLERAVNLTWLVWVCVLWLPGSIMDLSALWIMCFAWFLFFLVIPSCRSFEVRNLSTALMDILLLWMPMTNFCCSRGSCDILQIKQMQSFERSFIGCKIGCVRNVLSPDNFIDYGHASLETRFWIITELEIISAEGIEIQIGPVANTICYAIGSHQITWDPRVGEH